MMRTPHQFTVIHYIISQNSVIGKQWKWLLMPKSTPLKIYFAVHVIKYTPLVTTGKANYQINHKLFHRYLIFPLTLLTIQCSYSIGAGEASDILNTRTKGAKPIMPENSKFIEPSSNSVTLHLPTWKDGSCRMSHFVVEQKKKYTINVSIIFISNEKATYIYIPYKRNLKLIVLVLTPFGFCFDFLFFSISI